MTLQKKQFISLILFLILPFSSLFPQFILPEDKYTTHRDVDVIRIESDKFDIRQLRVRKSADSKGKVQLAWTVTNKKDMLAIVRSDKVISSLSAIQTGKVVSLLDPGTSSYTDTILVPGEYYYAVVSYPALKEETVILLANENYSTVPMHLTMEDISEQRELFKETVTDITAEILDNKSVRVKWVYDPTPNVSLLIYRSTAVISDESRLKSAIRIAVIPATKNYYDDQDTARGEFFYAIIVQNPAGLEKVILKENVNYTGKAVNKTEILSFSVKSLRAFVEGKNVLLTWYDREPRYTNQSIIYRSQNPIRKESDLSDAVITGRVERNVYEYTDKDVPRGKLYYAVLTQNNQGSVQKELISGENTLAEAVDVAGIPAKKEKVEEKAKPEKVSGLVYDLNALPERNGILVSWKPEKEMLSRLPQGAMYFHLFRFSQKPESMNDLSAKHYIAKIPLNEDSFFDNPPMDGFFYYAIFLTTPKGVLPADLKSGDNLVGPVIFKRTMAIPGKKEPYAIEERSDLDFSFYDDASQIGEDKLNEILRRTYLQKNYEEATKTLEDYRHSSSTKIRGRANFYSAISQYNLGNYDLAMKFIMDASVRKVFKDRADFWYKQILEKMGK